MSGGRRRRGRLQGGRRWGCRGGRGRGSRRKVGINRLPLQQRPVACSRCPSRSPRARGGRPLFRPGQRPSAPPPPPPPLVLTPQPLRARRTEPPTCQPPAPPRPATARWKRINIILPPPSCRRRRQEGKAALLRCWWVAPPLAQGTTDTLQAPGRLDPRRRRPPLASRDGTRPGTSETGVLLWAVNFLSLLHPS